MDAEYKDCYFEDETTVEKAKEIILEELLKIAEKNAEIDYPKENEDVQSTSSSSSFKDAMNSFKAKRAKLDGKANLRSLAEKVIEKYASEPPLNDGENTYKYWKHKSESIDPMERYLAQVAEIYLTPPASSADIERLFSTAGDIFTNETNRLKPENGEKKLFCRENFPLLKLQYD